MIEQLTAAPQVPSDQIRALQRMKDRSGFWILAGCAGDRVSYEANRYAQGLLTYSLLFGLQSGEGLKDNRWVNVLTLFDNAAGSVPRWAADIGGVQSPVIASPASSRPFDFGLLAPDSDQRCQIRVQQVRPVVVRSSFQEDPGTPTSSIWRRG